MSPRFHSLKINDVRRETPDAVSISFEIPQQLSELFRFIPGQYLTLRRLIEGNDIRRSYSICSSPSSGELRVAVKQVENGYFSTYANNELEPGDSVDVMPPSGRFSIGQHDGPRQIVAIAAGSGITPVLSIVAHTLQSEPQSQILLIYGNRESNSVLFRETLASMVDRYLGRFTIHHILSREEQDIPFLSGRVNTEKLDTVFSRLAPAGTVDKLLLCGPAKLIEAARARSSAHGLPAERVISEHFTPSHDAPMRPAKPKHQNKKSAAKAMATIIFDGRRRQAPIMEGQTVIEAGLAAGLDLPYACKGGMCCTCRCKILEGDAKMIANYSLEPWELEQNFTLACQALPKSNSITVDFDAK